MPFPQQKPVPFDHPNVEALTRSQFGCYGLFKLDVWVYVGKGDIRQRLLDHLNGDNICITRQGPTHFVSVLATDMDRAEKRLISELTPVCNQPVG